MLTSPKRSALISGLLHAAAVALVVIATRVRPQPPAEFRGVDLVSTHDISRYIPRLAGSTGRGGGGARDKTPASRGPIPRVDLKQFTPPSPVVRNYNPQLPMEPTLVGKPQILAAIPNIPFGDPNGVPGPPSAGRGKGGGIGDGVGTGVGDKDGPGYGDDDGAGVAGGPPHILGAITAPILLVKIDPVYSDEARRAKLQGVVVLHIDVDARGQARNIKVLESLGLGLDDRAIEAVRQWKFRPGTINGKPAVTAAVIHVTFRLL